MNRLTATLASVAALSLVLFLPAYADDDDDENQNYIPVESCDQVFLADGETYRLTQDLNCEGFEFFDYKVAFLLYGNDITLDLGGHTITCLSDPFDWLDTTGVFLDSSSKRLTVKNGRIVGCEIGVYAVLNERSTIRRLDVRDGVTGIYAASVSKAKIACNRSEGHLRGAIVLAGESSGSKIHQNIAKDSLTGISAYGFDPFRDFFPLPTGNRISNNTAVGNYLDVVEAYIDIFALIFDDELIVTSTDADDAVCRNKWRNNAYITQRGPNVGGRMCIRYSKELDDDDDGCAPGFDDDDDDDD